MSPPEGLTHDEWWAGLKIVRAQGRRRIPLRDRNDAPFSYSTPDPILRQLYTIDRDASGRIELPEAVANPQIRDRYIQSSLIEEAFTSSQLEGAVATRQQAQEMIRAGRRPVDRGERTLYQDGFFAQLIRPEQLLALAAPGAASAAGAGIAPGTVVFSGTLPVIGGEVRPTARFEAELASPGGHPLASLAYDITVLPPHP